MNPRLPASSPKFKYIAIVQKDLKSDPELIYLEAGLEASKNKFKALLKRGGPEKKYELGIMAHAQKRGFGWKFPTSNNLERDVQQKQNDIEEMIANYHIKVAKVFDKERNDEAGARLKTKKQVIDKAQAAFDRCRLLYKGKGEQLHRPY